MRVYDIFANLSRISARFAVRLVQAGTLNTLETLAAMALWREEHKAAAHAVLGKASRECLTTFGRSVPQVSRQGYGAGSACWGCMFAPNEHPTCHATEPGMKSTVVQCW